MLPINPRLLRRVAIYSILAMVSLILLQAFSDHCLASGQFDISVIDRETKLPIYARMHLKNGQGKPVKPPGAVFWNDHFVVPGHILLKLPKGVYTFELECGLEY